MTGRMLLPCLVPAFLCSTAVLSAPVPLMVQIGAFRHEAVAQAAASRFREAHAARLGGAQSEIHPTDLGPSGTWYRVFAGPFSDRSAADKTCAELKAAGTSCFPASAEGGPEPRATNSPESASPAHEPLPPWIVAAASAASVLAVQDQVRPSAAAATPTPAGQSDFERSLHLAEQGDAKAQLHLAGLYRAGRGIARDLDQAMRWYRAAAERGLAEAQFELGKVYDTGTGGPRDPFEAVRWYRLAAQQGHGRAQYNLGAMHGNGEGVPVDYVKAYMWFSISEATLPATERETARTAKGQAAQRMMQDDFMRAIAMAQRCLTSAYQNCD